MTPNSVTHQIAVKNRIQSAKACLDSGLSCVRLFLKSLQAGLSGDAAQKYCQTSMLGKAHCMLPPVCWITARPVLC